MSYFTGTEKFLDPTGIIGSSKHGNDSNGDSWLSMQESFEFAKITTEQWVTKRGLKQNPKIYNGLPDDYDPPLVQLQPPKPPVANFSHSPSTAWVNESVTFNASSSFSSNGNIIDYQWTFGDGNTTAVSEPTVNHTYTSTGNYAVNLNVTNSFGQWNATTRTITITYKTDLNRDEKVNIQDITIVAVAYKTKPGDRNWNPIADLDKNGEINIIDITMVARDYGKTV